MSEWFDENFDIEIYQERFQLEGTSKGRILRCFVEAAEPTLVARVLRQLWQYRCSLNGYTEADRNEEIKLKAWLEQFTNELESVSSLKLNDALKDFCDDATLPELRASIANDLLIEKPNVAIDRVHTYCVKRFRRLITSRNQIVTSNAPLQSLVGAYTRALRAEGLDSEFEPQTFRAMHRVFECLNQARNKHSFAHDNPLLGVSEAQFIVDCILASLVFVERIEDARKSQDTTLEDDIPF